VSRVPGARYWVYALGATALVSVLLSKLIFVTLLFTWGVLPQSVYDAVLYAGNWPSLATDTFPWFYDRNGTRGISILEGVRDVKSVIVNCLGQLPLGLAIGLALRKRGHEPRA
jgi:hypothetical protein